jgi:hypothetical protein
LQIHDENQTAAVAGKLVTAPTGATKRVALGEIGNTLRHAGGASIAPAKKTEVSFPISGAASAAGASVVPSAAAAAAASAAAASVAASAASAKLAPGVRNIDAADARNAGHKVDFIPEYVNDIMAHLLEREVRDAVNHNYLASQADLTENMRSILVDWLAHVHVHTRQQPETLHLAIRIMDTYLSIRPCLRSKLQLVGMTALLLASKIEEIHAVSIDTLLQLVDGAYDRNEALVFERTMLGALKWNVTLPTCYQFIQRFLRAAYTDRRVQLLSHYLAELCLLDYKMLRYPPSQVAAGCIWAALRMCNAGGWVRAAFLLFVCGDHRSNRSLFLCTDRDVGALFWLHGDTSARLCHGCADAATGSRHLGSVDHPDQVHERSAERSFQDPCADHAVIAWE